MSNGKMEKGKKGLFQIIYGRTLILILMLLLQVGLFISFYQFLQGYVIYIWCVYCLGCGCAAAHH